MNFWEIVGGLFLFFVFKYSFRTAYYLLIVGLISKVAKQKTEKVKGGFADAMSSMRGNGKQERQADQDAGATKSTHVPPSS